MDFGSPHALKEHLFRAYRGFSDKRIKNIEKGRHFIIDNRGNEPMNSAFCMIFVEVTEADQFSLVFQGNLPVDDGVKRLIESKGGTVRDRSGETLASVGSLTMADIDFIEMLQGAIRAVTRKPYKVKSWKYSAVRVTDSLDRLVDHLIAYRDSKPEPEDEPEPNDNRAF